MVECDETGQVISYEEYHPYGTTAYRSAKGGVEVSEKRYRYTGKERDEETGLGYHGARYYALWLGRWTTADPAGLIAGPNAYAYIRGRVIRTADTTGFMEDEQLAAVAETTPEERQTATAEGLRFAVAALTGMVWIGATGGESTANAPTHSSDPTYKAMTYEEAAINAAAGASAIFYLTRIVSPIAMGALATRTPSPAPAKPSRTSAPEPTIAPRPAAPKPTAAPKPINATIPPPKNTLTPTRGPQQGPAVAFNAGPTSRAPTSVPAAASAPAQASAIPTTSASTPAATASAAKDSVWMYRAVSPAEFEDIFKIGGFRPGPGGETLAGKQFGLSLEETVKFSNTQADLAAVVRVQIPRGNLSKFDFSKSIDPFIFKSGVVTVQPGAQQQLLNSTILSLEHVF